MANLLNIGISGLRVHQAALTVTGHNIANVDTEGYSRQEATITNNNPQFAGGIWVGSGAMVQEVRRVYDEFLVGQLQKDTSTFSYFETLTSNAEQVDKLLADPSTGIQPGIENMFGAIQAAVDDPSSLPARQVLISESQGLVDRFQSIQDRLNDSNNIINGQLGVIASQITTIGESIAELNVQIQFATASANGNYPNDLLDKRDLAIKELSELVSVSVVNQDNNSMNVFIGNGQPLVLGKDYNRLDTKAGTDDPTRDSIVFQRGNVTQDITNQLQGGEIGGLLDFRKTVLNPVTNQLGRVAIALQYNMNEQHALGIDINGQPGGFYFEDINSDKLAQSRVVGNANNAQPDDRVMGVYIRHPSELTDSEYKVEFAGPNDYSFTVTRVSNNELLLQTSLSTEYPESFNIDGFDLTFDGGSFKEGDQFYLLPTRTGASDIQLEIELPQEVALASAVMTNYDIGNIGQGVISSGVVYDANAEAFDIPGALSPPLVVKFTSATTFDVLDNSDPAHPKALFPSITNQTYVPGIVNNLLPINEGKTALSSLPGYLPANQFYQDYNDAFVTPGNGFFPARINISDPDPITGGMKSRGVLTIPAQTSAKETARILGDQSGITAQAITTLQLSNFQTDPNGILDAHLFLNGIELTDTLPETQVKYEKDYPEVVPDPVTADFIADRINANFTFQDMGITAKSDGSVVTITAINGEDLSLEMQGDNEDSMTVSNGFDTYLKATGNPLPKPLSKYEGYDFSEGGPFTYEFEVPGQGSFNIELTDTYDTGADLLAGIESAITSTQFFFNGDLDIDIDAKGNILFQSQLEMSPYGTNGSAKLTMGGRVKVVLDDGIKLSSEPPFSNLFEAQPEHKPIYMGYELTMEGRPEAGDQFFVDFNTDAVTDNRNGAFLGNIQNREVVEGDMTISESYGRTVEEIGSITARAQINEESSEVLLQNTQDSVNAVSGVNLDEEAAKLIQYELGYNASAQVISVARDIFNTLIGIF